MYIDIVCIWKKKKDCYLEIILMYLGKDKNFNLKCVNKVNNNVF